MEELQQQILSWCDTLEEYLKCGQCRGPLIRDTYLCEAGHFVCLTCSQDSPNDKCSICKMKYTKTRNYLAENLAEKMETIRKKIGGNVEDDDDFRSVTSENSNASWNTFPCWIWNCKVQGSIEEIRQHYKESHSGVYVKHCDGKLPHSTSFFLDYSFPRTMDRLLDIPDVGLFLLHVVVYDNGALRAHLLMYDSGRNARKYRYKLKIQCNAQNFSVEGVVDTVRIPKNLLAKKGLFVQRAHNLQIELQKTLKFTCHVEVDRNTQPPEEKASQKLTGARYKSRNQKSTDDQTDSTANTITEDSSDLKKKPQKNFQKNRDKLTNGNPQNSQEKPKNPIPKISNPQKKQNSEAKAENVRKPIKSKSPELQNHQSRVDDPLQTSGGQNSPRQGGFGGNLGGSGGTIPPVFAHPPPFGSMPSYGSQGMGYQSPGGGANYPPGVLPPQGLPSNPHHFGATPGVFPGANPHYRPPPSPGTPEIPGAHHGQPSAPVEDGNGGYVQYPDLTNMKHKMMDEVQRKVIAKERMRGTRTSSTESKDKCVIS
ncbi:uncharacterized protein LOC107039661 isoform X2 [Diachasma alloeum]|uniref:uncharacterized protein LOC107039661 isoform X2 n=1 Tax=Diachasma alloeum TaxID=454923 RepID=UPI00073835BD|nr:uncharacterized protein LOC107039661 isoform X2 [Diachasma alloeum]